MLFETFYPQQQMEFFLAADKVVCDLKNITEDPLESLIFEEYKNSSPFLIKVCQERATYICN